jgi:hypothetical protein
MCRTGLRSRGDLPVHMHAPTVSTTAIIVTYTTEMEHLTVSNLISAKFFFNDPVFDLTIVDTTARPNEGRRRQSVSMDDRTSRTSSSNRASASASASLMEKEEEDAPVHYQPCENTSKKDNRRRNSTARGEEREVDEYVPPVHGTLSKAHNDFNRIVELKDPLPGIIADMAIAPVASRIVHRRSSRHSAPSIVTEYGEAGIRKSPKDAPFNGRALTAGERLSRRIQEEADEEQEDEDDEDDEVLTEDQDSIPVKGSR